ncbi:hypothetical protein GCM10010387_50340 [Streptomyces inusitatus]|uniref:Uncharacterized protein n=1 Tax=Streptomyces inusitatus TaxID=68221 RepID=A0A918QJG6_9ACTN|nr:hypothetical protein GCM10010387_50340 [Streptomyces inusitatus]
MDSTGSGGRGRPGLRPQPQVIHLRKAQCRLPAAGWGLLNLKGGVVTAGKEWADNGSVREIHSLKRRAAKATRPVPIPLILVRIFRNAKGDYIDASAYGSTWNRAHEAALTLDEHALELAKRPYDLRRAGQRSKSSSVTTKWDSGERNRK